MSILIVDDLANSRLVLRTYLQAAGHHDLRTAALASQAFEILGMTGESPSEPSDVDLILLDVFMPGIDGIEACRRIKMVPRLQDIPIIMVTGRDEEECLKDAFAAGAIDYIAKPVNKVELQARVSSALALKREIDSRRLAYRELEKQLLQSQKLASIGRLVGGVAHDFNNALTLIMGYAQLGVIYLPSGHGLRGNLQELIKTSEHAATLTRQLLALSRQQSDQPRVLNPNEIIHDLSQMLRRLIGEDLDLSIILGAEAGHVKIDPTQLEQVLMNLVINARDAMPQGGKLIIETTMAGLPEGHNIGGSALPPGSYTVLKVSDTGVGIPPEIQARIFEPFFTTKGDKGTGLGLATCQSIIQESGGCMAVDSQPGQGTVFIVYLPQADELSTEAPAAECPAFILAQGTETILLAEDEPAVRTMVTTILQDQGYTVLQATDGDEALSISLKHDTQRIDLLLADVVMPRMGGIELAHQLRATRPGTKVLLTSGYSDDDVNILKPGLDLAFIQKPFLPAALAGRIREILDT